MSHRLPVFFTALCLSLGAANAFGAQPRIGVAAAVQNRVEGVQSGAPRALSVGSEVFSNERIRTGDASTAQLLFLDKTSVSIGPKAELTLDRFVYNPDRGTGQVVLDTLRGSFRFVTGSQNPNNYTIKTPVATLGIRGTIIDLLVQAGRTIVVLVEGAVSIKLSNGQVLTLNKPGTAFVIGTNGQVQGPIAWDGTIVNVANGVPFPLYGWTFSGDPKKFEGPISNIDRIDQLNAIDARNYVPPPSPPSGGGNEGPYYLNRR
jgi:hypothetical protein